MEILAGVGDLCTWLQEQLQSVASLVAVDGALSTSPSVVNAAAAAAASPASSDFALLLLDWLLALLAVLPEVDVRCSGALVAKGAVRGGLTSEGDAMEMDLRKSI